MNGKLLAMTTTDYLISAALVLLVIPQIIGSRLTMRTALLPVVAVAAAAAHYLKSFPPQGHDLRLDVVGVAVGAALGVASGLATRISRTSDGVAFAKAGVLAALLWVVGMASRSAFVFWATHSGSATVARFSRDHLITGAAAWTAALLLMAVAQVLCRLVVVRLRARQIPAAVPAPAGV
ncbi:hypothetical protein ACFV2X_32350 [Streptomyces sp. NPDC059679]|uniref:hypothetical protein n=1 Tax=Streptomyces sp. NPDC059679 TaxID=3346903 RepID=UPI0036B1EA54